MKTVIAKEWDFIEVVPTPSSKSPSFSVIVRDPDLSPKPVVIRVPYDPVTDTGISPDTHDLYIEAPKARPNAKRAMKASIRFVEKSSIEEGGVQSTSSYPNTPISATFSGARIARKRKAIIDPASGAAITVGSGAVAAGPSGKETIFTRDGMTVMSGSPIVPDLPQDDHVVLKKIGLIALLPKAFIPPFCTPEFLPSLQFVAQVSGTIATFKAIRALTKETF